MLTLERIEVRALQLPLARPFETSFMRETVKDCLLVRCQAQGGEADQCRRALQLGAARVINVKPGRVGGFSASRRIHDLCAARHVPCWVGGMLETGVGRLQNLALASLENFRLPGDLSASRRYFARDIIEPAVELQPDGSVKVPTECGVASRLCWSELEAATQHREIFVPE